RLRHSRHPQTRPHPATSTPQSPSRYSKEDDAAQATRDRSNQEETQQYPDAAPKGSASSPPTRSPQQESELSPAQALHQPSPHATETFEQSFESPPLKRKKRYTERFP